MGAIIIHNRPLQESDLCRLKQRVEFDLIVNSEFKGMTYNPALSPGGENFFQVTRLDPFHGKRSLGVIGYQFPDIELFRLQMWEVDDSHTGCQVIATSDFMRSSWAHEAMLRWERALDGVETFQRSEYRSHRQYQKLLASKSDSDRRKACEAFAGLGNHLALQAALQVAYGDRYSVTVRRDAMYLLATSESPTALNALIELSESINAYVAFTASRLLEFSRGRFTEKIQIGPRILLPPSWTNELDTRLNSPYETLKPDETLRKLYSSEGKDSRYFIQIVQHRVNCLLNAILSVTGCPTSECRTDLPKDPQKLVVHFAETRVDVANIVRGPIRLTISHPHMRSIKKQIGSGALRDLILLWSEVGMMQESDSRTFFEQRYENNLEFCTDLWLYCNEMKEFFINGAFRPPNATSSATPFREYENGLKQFLAKKVTSLFDEGNPVLRTQLNEVVLVYIDYLDGYARALSMKHRFNRWNRKRLRAVRSLLDKLCHLTSHEVSQAAVLTILESTSNDPHLDREWAKALFMVSAAKISNNELILRGSSDAGQAFR